MARESDEKVEAPGKKSPVMLIVVGINMLVVLGVGAWFLLGSRDAAGSQPAPAAPVGGAVGGGAVGGAVVIDPANFVTSEMQPFIVNLLDEDGNRYLKLSAVVRLANEDAKERFATLKPAVRDRFIQHVTSLSVQDLTTPEKKRELKQSLVQGANEVVPRGDVIDVYFTDFVIQ